MKQKPAKHQHMTISIPYEVKHSLYLHVKARGRSRFIAEAIEEKLNDKKISLEEQYKLAANDEERNQQFNDWEQAMLGDGLNENNDW